MTTATQSEFAALLGKDKSYVTRLKQAGRLVFSADGKSVDVEASHKRIAATADPSKDHVTKRLAETRTPPRGGGATSDSIGNSYQTARAVREKYAALAAQAAYELTIGNLLERSLHDQAMADVVLFARQGLENLPHRVAGLLVGKDHDQIIATLKNEVLSLMDEMHREAGRQLAELPRVNP